MALSFYGKAKGTAATAMSARGFFVNALAEDALQLWQTVKENLARGGFWRWLVLLTLLAGTVRLVLLPLPLGHDEAYTFVGFASRSLPALLSDYSLPNNHIFHSLLVHLSTELFGVHPWSVRLPAFMAGVLAVPVAALLGMRLYGKTSGLLAAAMLAGLPSSAMYAGNARGYSLYMLFSLVLFCLAPVLVRRRNRAGWLLLVITGSLGFWTVPFMLYPFGGVLLWMFLLALTGEVREAYGSAGKFILYLVGAGLATAGLAALFYAPVVIWGTGWHSLIGNSFVQRLTWEDFLPTLLVRLQETAREWSIDLPQWLGWMITACGFIPLIWHARLSRERVSPWGAALLWLVLVLPVQRTNPLARLWTYLIPLWVLSGATGGVALWRWLTRRWPQQRSTGVGVVLSVLLVGGLVLATWLEYGRPGRAGVGQVERAAMILLEAMQPGDVVLAVEPDDAPLWFYLLEKGAGREYFELKRVPELRQFYLVLDPSKGQTVEGVLRERGLDPALCPSASVQAWRTVGTLEIKRCRLVP
ncbi:MAG TPA: hypothetical protein DEQ80_10740 [Anaerolinea thermolimosa]|uniref:Glycosyltransferase RgtA/B/C/D-like domain-containing protein n=1 Tax=Anaerolinea thermolimosa TaxID=229919 RepID=A0A3D1JJC2_9CHLR|nr:hypothetical protein [Anaerolinea thermolimosa]